MKLARKLRVYWISNLDGTNSGIIAAYNKVDAAWVCRCLGSTLEIDRGPTDARLLAMGEPGRLFIQPLQGARTAPWTARGQRHPNYEPSVQAKAG